MSLICTTRDERRAIRSAIENVVNGHILYDWGYYDDNYNHDDCTTIEHNFMVTSGNNGYFSSRGVDVLYLSDRRDLKK